MRWWKAQGKKIKGQKEREREGERREKERMCEWKIDSQRPACARQVVSSIRDGIDRRLTEGANAKGTERVRE